MWNNGRQPFTSLLKVLLVKAAKVLRETRTPPPLVKARCRVWCAGRTWLKASHTVALIILLGLELRWTLVCLDKWSLRANFFSHREHS